MSFVSTHWFLILTVTGYVINGLIVGLTDYPRAETWLHYISDLLAFVTHRNSNGTFKAPGKRSTPPDGEVPYGDAPPPPK